MGQSISQGDKRPELQEETKVFASCECARSFLTPSLSLIFSPLFVSVSSLRDPGGR
jgi:hypothetical protein